MKNIIKFVKKVSVIRLILAVIFISVAPSQASAALIHLDEVNSCFKNSNTASTYTDQIIDKIEGSLVSINGVTLVSASQPVISVVKVYETYVTAYSSSVDETDNTPFLTASGELVRDGIVAANFLPFGTKIRIPEVFGNKIFVVKDRMAKKHADKIDVWLESKELAKTFGKKKLIVEVVESKSF